MIKLIILSWLFFGLTVASPFKQKDEKTCGYQTCTKADPEKLNVHIIPHSHDDVGWLKSVDGYYYEDVQKVITTVITALKLNPERRFIQVETAYFRKWWEVQNNATKESVIELLNNGQLEICGGGWSMNDEAAVHYQSTIDQYTQGFRYLEDNLGPCAKSTVTWQIDPFGHSREQASIAAQLGFDSFFFARLDYRDKSKRRDDKTMDLLWRGSANLGDTDVFTSTLFQHYSAPSGFCFDISCDDTPIIDDEESPDYNYEQRVSDFADHIKDQALYYPTNNILITMGDDFKYQAAHTTFMNLDLLIKGFERFEHTFEDKPINVFYSTPACYTKAVNDLVNSNNQILDLKTDDFMPYADGSNTPWTGYFTSRPASKRFERDGNNLLQVLKQLGSFAEVPYADEKINALRDAMGVMQHHDAITGTEKQAVTSSYHQFLANALDQATVTSGSILSAFITGDAEGDGLELKSCLLSNVSYCEESKSDKFVVVVYNPLSRPVSTSINLPVESESWKITDPNGDEVTYQTVETLKDFSYITDIEHSPYILVFSADNIPQLGYNVYQIEKVDAVDVKHEEVNEEKKKTSKIGYDETSIELDEDTGLLKSVTMSGVTADVSQDFLYYSSSDSSGAYIFSPTPGNPERIATDKVTNILISGDVFEGVIQEFGDWAKQIIKVYKNEPNYVEFDWIIGPIDISAGVGKEVITQYTTSLNTNSKFYTDSNGRELLERTRNHRPTYDYTDEQPVSGNYYPINNRIVLKDEEQGVEFAIITDRSEGGGSINDGQVEIMIHRACHHDDARGVGENLNEQQYDQGIVVRGQHYLVLGPASGNGQKSLAAIERDIAQRIQLAPWVFVSDKDISAQLQNLQYQGLVRALDDNVFILTLEPWNDKELLIRLEHILELNEDENLSQEVTVDLTDLFTEFKITELRETTLGGNTPIEDKSRLTWPLSEKNANKARRETRDVQDLSIALSPMEIRTFIATIEYN